MGLHFSRRVYLQFFALGTFVAILLAWSGHSAVLRGMGTYLIVQDPLERADAIVVVSGHPPVRALEAATLYHEGWAPKVIVTRALRSKEYYMLQALGITVPEEREYNREILLKREVPLHAVILIEREAANTREELQTVVDVLRRSNWATAIIVTSKYHSRRSQKIWRYLTHGKPKAITRWARQDPFGVDRWWKERGPALAVVREYLGLLNYSFGFPLG